MRRSELVEETGERFYEAELYRQRGELLMLVGDEAAAESSFMKSIEVSRSQQAKSWELRTATSLARLWQKQGRMDEAYQLLGDVYGWFTEGFDTRDLVDASLLLEEIAETRRDISS